MFSPFVRMLSLAAAGLLLLAGAARPAAAQLTARDLLGRTNDIGVSHADVDAAIQQFLRGEFVQAREAMSAAIVNHPELPPAEVIMAMLFFRSKVEQLQDDGLLALERATVQAPADPEPYIMIAEAGLPARRYAAADALYEKAARLTNDYAANDKRKHDFKLRIYAGLATVAEGREQFNKQAGFLKSWVNEATKSGAPIPMDPNTVAGIVYKLGQAYFRDGKFQEAEATFAQAKQRDPNLPLPAIAMASMYNNQGDVLSAQRYFSDAAQAGADDFRTQMTLAQWELEQDQPQQAKVHADKASAMQPDAVEATLLRGVVDRVLGDHASAVSWFEKAHLQAPTDFTVTNQLALALAGAGDEESKRRAVQFAEVNYKLFSSNDDAASTLGWVYYVSGQTPAALKVLNSAQRTTGLSADGSYYVATMYERDGKTAEAKQYLEKAFQGKLSYPVRRDAKALAAKLGVTP